MQEQDLTNFEKNDSNYFTSTQCCPAQGWPKQGQDVPTPRAQLAQVRIFICIQ